VVIFRRFFAYNHIKIFLQRYQNLSVI